MGFYNWAIGANVAKYPGRIVVAENSLEGLGIVTLVKADTAETIPTTIFLDGMYIYDPDGGVCALTTPTAAQIVAELGAVAEVRTAFKFLLRHAGSAGAGEKITLTAGAGVTLSPTVQAVEANEILNTLVRIDHIGGEYDTIGLTVTDTADATLEAFFAEGGELYAAKGYTIAIGDLFKVTSTGDVTSNALATAKGSAVAANDIFVVTGLGGSAAVTYVRSDSPAVTIYSLGLDLMTT